MLAGTDAIEELTPAGPAIEPRTDVTWRQEAHADWRRFVQASVPAG
jgi:hypothetical protein